MSARLCMLPSHILTYSGMCYLRLLLLMCSLMCARRCMLPSHILTYIGMCVCVYISCDVLSTPPLINVFSHVCVCVNIM